MTRPTFGLTLGLTCALLMPFAASALTVPAGTALWVRTLDPVSSSDPPGKTFAARLDTGLVVNGKVAANAGTKVYGRVEASQSAGRAFGRSKLALRLTRMVVKGQPVALATGNYEQAGARSGRKTAGRAAAGAAVGAAFGNAAAGAAIGASTGLIGEGQSVVAPAGTLFEFRLTQPVAVRVSSFEPRRPALVHSGPPSGVRHSVRLTLVVHRLPAGPSGRSGRCVSRSPWCFASRGGRPAVGNDGDHRT